MVVADTMAAAAKKDTPAAGMRRRTAAEPMKWEGNSQLDWEGKLKMDSENSYYCSERSSMAGKEAELRPTAAEREAAGRRRSLQGKEKKSAGCKEKKSEGCKEKKSAGKPASDCWGRGSLY